MKYRFEKDWNNFKHKNILHLPHNFGGPHKIKIEQKNCDWLIANNVSDNTIGFDADYNEVTIFYKDKST